MGLNQSKNELDGQISWLTQYQNIEKWWEIVLVLTYLLVCLAGRNSDKLAPMGSES